MTGQQTKKARSFSGRSLRADEYETLSGWQVGTLHRASTSPASPALTPEQSQALERLEKRPGYVMDADDPMRLTAAKSELAIEEMMARNDRATDAQGKEPPKP